MDNSACENCRQRSKGDAALRRLKGILTHLKRNVRPTKGAKLSIIWDFRVKCSQGLYCNALEQTKNQINKYGVELEQYICTLAYTGELEDELNWTLEQLKDHFPLAYDAIKEGHDKLRGR